ncbi:hypothetical protein [Halorubrum lipolyticum]|uniref:hypothetical protein n=1 Tax=Halorubrum lipolyticum TaxID=368624 RepID=UPI0011C98A75|nr:hypothetical protein [Halorubrum lipolyticum]
MSGRQAANREGPKVPLAAGGDDGARESLAAVAASDRARAKLSLAAGRSPATRLGRCEVRGSCGRVGLKGAAGEAGTGDTSTATSERTK